VHPRDRSGFTVGLRITPSGFTVYFEGWHEEFTSEDEALNCFAFGLSPKCRLRDLVDLVLILEREALAMERVRAAVDATFQRRGTHSVPDVVPDPPSGWAKPFAALAAECELEQTLAPAHKHVEAPKPHLHGHAPGDTAAERVAHASVRPDSCAGRPEALLGWR
jgi:hypothetical protein